MEPQRPGAWRTPAAQQLVSGLGQRHIGEGGGWMEQGTEGREGGMGLQIDEHPWWVYVGEWVCVCVCGATCT